MFRKALHVCVFIILASACVPLTPGPDLNLTATQIARDISATQTAASIMTSTVVVPSPTSTTEALPVPGETITPTPAPVDIPQFIAYIKDGQLLVTDVTNNMLGGTTQYTVAGQNDQVMDLAWSPSGEFVAFVSTATSEPHIFYIYALGQSSPTDLGSGNAPAWSPDSQSVAYIGGTFPNENIFVTTIENPSPRQLTFESNYAWGRPAFTPDGNALIVSGTNRDNMGASGNTSFSLEILPLDGSSPRVPLPYSQSYDGVRLPYDLRFSPDGKQLAFSTSSHLSACAAPGAYYISNADGSSQQELISPSMQAAVDPNLERYHTGLSFDWLPSNDAIVGLGNVMDCNLNSPTTGQVIAGPQMSIIGLDGSERTIIPGFFYGISVDRTGSLIAAAHYQDGFQDVNPDVEVYSAETGQQVLSLGPGSNPRFQP